MSSRDIPIIFSAPMIRALLDGRKTQTRRVLKPQPAEYQPRVLDIRPPQFNVAGQCEPGEEGWGQVETEWLWERGQPSEPLREIWRPLKGLRIATCDRLWVRENVRGEEIYTTSQDGVRYKADNEFRPIANTGEAAVNWLHLHTYRGHSGHQIGPWVPPIHMPRWASRLTLLVKSVKVERLQDISEADAIAEGWPHIGNNGAGAPLAEAYPIGWFGNLWRAINGPDAWDANPWVAAIGFRVVRANIDSDEAHHGR